MCIIRNKEGVAESLKEQVSKFRGTDRTSPSKFMALRSSLFAHGLMPDDRPTFTSWTGRKRGGVTENEVWCSVFDILFGGVVDMLQVTVQRMFFFSC